MKSTAITHEAAAEEEEGKRVMLGSIPLAMTKSELGD